MISGDASAFWSLMLPGRVLLGCQWSPLGRVVERQAARAASPHLLAPPRIAEVSLLPFCSPHETALPFPVQLLPALPQLQDVGPSALAAVSSPVLPGGWVF